MTLHSGDGFFKQGHCVPFPPFESEIRRLSASLDYSDDDTHIQSSPRVTWPAGVLRETNGSPVMVIQAGENVPAATFALHCCDSVFEVLLQVVVGSEILPRTGLQEVAVPEEWQDER